MGTETTSLVVHPEGEQPEVEAMVGGRRHLRRSGSRGVGRDGAGDAIRPTAGFRFIEGALRRAQATSDAASAEFRMALLHLAGQMLERRRLEPPGAR